jgi:hypothetical protein
LGAAIRVKKLSCAGTHRFLQIDANASRTLKNNAADG